MNKIDYPSLLGYLFWSELRSDLDKFMLGAIWWILEPALYVTVFYFLFAELKGAGNFAITLVCGIVTWQWLIGVINSGANSVLRKKQIVQNFNVHPVVFPAVTLLTCTFRYIFVLTFAVTLFVWKGALNLGPLLDIVLWVFTAIITIFSYAVLLSLVTPFLPDLQMLISRAATLMMFLSGVIFPISDMPQEAQNILYWNPLAHLIEGGRNILLNGVSTDRIVLASMILTHIPILLFGFLMLDKLRGEIPKRLV